MSNAQENQIKLTAALDAKAFGATGGGVVNDYAALAALVTSAKLQTAPHVVIPPGTYALGANTLTFDLPSGSTLECHGEFTSTISSAPAVRLGSTTANTFYLTVSGLRVRRLSNDTSGGSTGVQVRNLVWSKMDVRAVSGFQDGLLLYGDQANGGVSYCEFSLGFLHDNLRNLMLTAAGSGYCNENNFFGGSFNHSTGYPAVATVNLEVGHFASDPLNNNRFWGPSLEDNSTLAVAAVVHGTNNLIAHPRIERSVSQSTYQIQFTANAIECALTGNGFTLVNTNVSDLGTNTCYETREGRRISHQVADDAAKAVVSLQSTSTSNARLLRFLDSSGAVVGWVKGTGQAQLVGLLLSGLGNYANDAAAASGGVAVGQLYRNASAVQVRVA